MFGEIRDLEVCFQSVEVGVGSLNGFLGTYLVLGSQEKAMEDIMTFPVHLWQTDL